MANFWTAWGWFWNKKLFFGVMLAATVLFFVWIFPFSDLSQIVTTQVMNATGSQVYVQTETLNLHFVPTPSVSATGISVETTMPPIEAKWAKFTPGMFSVLMNIRSMMKAQSDPAAAQAMMTSLSFSLDAEDVFGADVDFSMGPGKKSEGGVERSRVSLAMENLNLGQVQNWADLPVKLQGSADFETDMNLSPSFQEQPDGDFVLRVKKFNLPASTVMLNLEGAIMPLNLPTLTLANVELKGRLTNGQLIIEEGTFGQSSDPLHGRIKGQLGLRLQPVPGGVAPIIGAYNITADLSATKSFQKDLALAFAFLSQSETQTPTGFRYLFRAQGSGIGAPPSFTRLGSF